MLITNEQIKELKRVNVSKDSEKTKERIKEAFSGATAAQKRAISEVAGQVVNSFYRVYETGTATAKVVLAIASELNITPYYLTGETDEKEPCTLDLIKQFLTDNKYSDIAASLDSKPAVKTKRQYNRKPKEEVIATAVDSESHVQQEQKEAVSADEDLLFVPSNNASTGELSKCSCDSPDECDVYEVSEALTEDEAIVLLKGMFIRARIGGKAASDLETVKMRLLS